MLLRNLFRTLALLMLCLSFTACDETGGQPADNGNPGTGAQPAEDVSGAITESGYAAFDAIRAADDAVPEDVRAGLAPFAGTADSTIVSSGTDECDGLEIFDRDRQGVTFDFGDRGVTMSNESVNLNYQYFAATDEFCRPYAPGFVECLDFDAGSGREYHLRIYRETDDENGPAYAFPCYASRHRLSQSVAAEPVAPPAPVEAEPAPEVAEATNPEPVPDPEPMADPEPQFAAFETPPLGISVGGWDHYRSGDTIISAIGYSNPDAHVFVKADTCSMEVEVHPLPLSALPAPSLTDALGALVQRDYVDAQSNAEWTVLEEPTSLEVNGLAAARLLAERFNPSRDSRLIYQFTLIAGETRAALVEGQVSKQCADDYGSVDSLSEIADSVRVYQPEPTCYVGSKPGTDPVEYAVACDGQSRSGPSALALFGNTTIELGPVVWDECALFMRERGVSGW